MWGGGEGVPGDGGATASQDRSTSEGTLLVLSYMKRLCFLYIHT